MRSAFVSMISQTNSTYSVLVIYHLRRQNPSESSTPAPTIRKEENTYRRVGKKLLAVDGVETEVMTVNTPSPVTPTAEDPSDSTDGSYEVEVKPDDKKIIRIPLSKVSTPLNEFDHL